MTNIPRFQFRAIVCFIEGFMMLEFLKVFFDQQESIVGKILASVTAILSGLLFSSGVYYSFRADQLYDRGKP